MKTLRHRIDGRRARVGIALLLCVSSIGLAVLSFAARPATDSPIGKNAGKSPALAQTEADWMIVSSPNTSPAQSNFLYGVTCATASECWAVGSYGNGSAQQTLIQKWDGAAWSIVSSPNTSSTLDNVLQGVTCSSANDCWAVGFHSDTSSIGQTLIERWNGVAWSIVSSPNTGPTQTNILFGVACNATNDCWAGGSYFNGSVSQTLVQKWDGISWSIVSSANNGTTRDNGLKSVTCTSANSCWAVGSYDAGGFLQTLILSWDGATWISRSAPNADTTRSNSLAGVTCTAPNDCWAVGTGFRAGSTFTQPLIVRWQGGLWDIVASPSISPDRADFLEAVTCPSLTQCWAVGRHVQFGSHTFIERWDGTAWSIVTSPDNGSLDNLFYSVTCASARECWAVGTWRMPPNPPLIRTLIEGRFGLEIVSVAHLANNHKLVNCLGIPGQVNNLQASSDLNPANFVNVSPPPPAADANGSFQYDDTNTGTPRFYRLVFP